MQKFAFYSVVELFKDMGFRQLITLPLEHPDKSGNPFPYIREGAKGMGYIAGISKNYQVKQKL